MVESERSKPISLVHDQVRERVLKKIPGSILRLAPEVNKAFGGALDDSTPVESLVIPYSDESEKRYRVQLSEIWDSLESTPKDREKMERIFYRICRPQNRIITVGDIRRLAQNGRIRRLVGLNEISEVFLADCFIKIEDSDEQLQP